MTDNEGRQVDHRRLPRWSLEESRLSPDPTASKRLEARPTAVIEGELSTPVLLVAEGAQIVAQIEMPERQRKAQLAVAV